MSTNAIMPLPAYVPTQSGATESLPAATAPVEAQIKPLDRDVVEILDKNVKATKRVANASLITSVSTFIPLAISAAAMVGMAFGVRAVTKNVGELTKQVGEVMKNPSKLVNDLTNNTTVGKSAEDIVGTVQGLIGKDSQVMRILTNVGAGTEEGKKFITELTRIAKETDKEKLPAALAEFFNKLEIDEKLAEPVAEFLAKAGNKVDELDVQELNRIVIGIAETAQQKVADLDVNKIAQNINGVLESVQDKVKEVDIKGFSEQINDILTAATNKVDEFDMEKASQKTGEILDSLKGKIDEADIEALKKGVSDLINAAIAKITKA